MIQTAIWIPPSLCGCQLQITGDFDSEQIHDGISYKHPKPFTITNLKILSVCADHEPQSLEMIDTGIFFDPVQANEGVHAFLAQKKGVIASSIMRQNRGYLKYPIDNPTPAECLYTFLSQYSGTINRQSCGCSAFICGDEKGETAFVSHPLNSKQCDFHIGDTPDMKQAQADCADYLASIQEVDSKAI